MEIKTLKRRRKDTKKTMKHKLLAVFIFALSLVLSIAYFVFEDFFREATSFGLIGLFLVNLISSASLFLSAPAFLTVIAGGNLYQPFLVGVIASLGAAVGDMISFLFGFSGRKLTRKKLERSKKILVLERYFKKYGALIIFLVAIIPNPLFDAIGIFAGVLNYSPVKFFVIVFVGRLLRYWLLAKVAASIS